METSSLDLKQLKPYMIPAAVGLTILVISLTLFRTTLINLTKIKLERSQSQKYLAELTRKAQVLQSLDKQEIESRILKLEEVLPSEKPVLNLIALLIKLSSEEGVIFSGLTLNPGAVEEEEKKLPERVKVDVPVAENKLEEIPIGFTIQGNIQAIISFIAKLEKTSPLMRIEGIGLSLSGPQASLNVKVYYQPLPTTMGPITQPVPLLTEKEKGILNEIASYREAEFIPLATQVGKEDLFGL